MILNSFKVESAAEKTPSGDNRKLLELVVSLPQNTQDMIKHDI